MLSVSTPCGHTAPWKALNASRRSTRDHTLTVDGPQTSRKSASSTSSINYSRMNTSTRRCSAKTARTDTQCGATCPLCPLRLLSLRIRHKVHRRLQVHRRLRQSHRLRLLRRRWCRLTAAYPVPLFNTGSQLLRWRVSGTARLEVARGRTIPNQCGCATTTADRPTSATTK